jgi:hypothetical protein
MDPITIIKTGSLAFKIALAIGIVLIIIATLFIIIGILGYTKWDNSALGGSMLGIGIFFGVIGGLATWITYRGFVGRIVDVTKLGAKTTFAVGKKLGSTALNIGQSLKTKITGKDEDMDNIVQENLEEFEEDVKEEIEEEKEKEKEKQE